MKYYILVDWVESNRLAGLVQSSFVLSRDRGAQPVVPRFLYA